MPKLTWGIGIALAGVVALTAVAIARPRRDVELPPPGKSSGKPVLDSCCLADELASRSAHLTPATPPAPVAVATVRVRGRVQLPWPEKKKSEYGYTITVFTPEGKIESQLSFVNTERFELPAVSPGRKALLFCPVMASMTFASTVIVVPERGDVDIVLKPQLPALLTGRIVDAGGSGIGGVTVSAQESLSLTQELYLQGKPSSAAVLEWSEVPLPGTPETSPMGLRIDPLAGRLTRSVTSDSRGHFTLPISSATDPLPLTILRGKTDVLKEEVVLPANGPVRIVVPNQ